MEKRFLLAGLAMLAIPGCGCRNERGHVRHIICKEEPACIETCARPDSLEQNVMPDRKSQRSQPASGEDIEGFAFEEPGNTFKLLDETGTAPMPGTPEEREAWFDERAEAAQKHGFKTIYFGFAEHNLRKDQEEALEQNLKKIHAATKKGTVLVEGHACSFGGNREYNIHLSHERAKAVKDFLVERGIPEEKLKVVGRGNDMKIVREGDCEQQAPNRRVEFHLLGEGQKEPMAQEPA